MLEVRGGIREESRNNLCCCFTFKRRAPDRFQLNKTPLLFALLNLELTSRHFQMHVDTGYIPTPKRPSFKKRSYMGFVFLCLETLLWSENWHTSWEKAADRSLSAEAAPRWMTALCSAALRLASHSVLPVSRQLCVWGWPGKTKPPPEQVPPHGPPGNSRLIRSDVNGADHS